MTGAALRERAREADILEVVEDLGFELIIEASELIESIAISTREATWRRDRAEVRLRLDHLRLAVIAALETVREVNGGAP
jgi:hypothetical protein